MTRDDWTELAMLCRARAVAGTGINQKYIDLARRCEAKADNSVKITRVEFRHTGERYMVLDNNAFFELFIWEGDGTGFRPITDPENVVLEAYNRISKWMQESNSV